MFCSGPRGAGAYGHGRRRGGGRHQARAAGGRLRVRPGFASQPRGGRPAQPQEPRRLPGEPRGRRREDSRVRELARAVGCRGARSAQAGAPAGAAHRLLQRGPRTRRAQAHRRAVPHRRAVGAGGHVRFRRGRGHPQHPPRGAVPPAVQRDRVQPDERPGGPRRQVRGHPPTVQPPRRCTCCSAAATRE